MRVQFTQSGGYVGVIRHCTLDTSSMETDEARTLEQLVRDADLSASEEKLSPSGRDLERYDISVDDGGRSVKVVYDQSTVTPECRALVAFLKKYAKPGVPG
jgi:hypothetical protein